MADEKQETEEYLVIDGEEYDLSDKGLTFGEQRKLRRYARALAEDPELELNQAALMDFLPALVTVIKQRTESAFTVEMAEELRYEDVVHERPVDPTPAVKTKTRAASGTPK